MPTKPSDSNSIEMSNSLLGDCSSSRPWGFPAYVPPAHRAPSGYSQHYTRVAKTGLVAGTTTPLVLNQMMEKRSPVYLGEETRSYGEILL